MLPQQYCLRWKYHHSNLQTMFSQLLDRGCFCDVTLACEGQLIRAHRVVLCACSTFFDTVLTNYASERDPIIIMKDVTFADVKALIEFMYKGEINVEHANLASLLKTADDLKIKGLAEVSWRDDEDVANGVSGGVPPPPPDTEYITNSPQRMHDGYTISAAAPDMRGSPIGDNVMERRSAASPLHHNNKHQLPTRLPMLTPIPTSSITIAAASGADHYLGPKRKRGRPPLDDAYDVFNVRKVPHYASHLDSQPFVDAGRLHVTQHEEQQQRHSTSAYQQHIHQQQRRQRQKHEQKQHTADSEDADDNQTDPEWITSNLEVNVAECEAAAAMVQTERESNVSPAEQQSDKLESTEKDPLPEASPAHDRERSPIETREAAEKNSPKAEHRFKKRSVLEKAKEQRQRESKEREKIENKNNEDDRHNSDHEDEHASLLPQPVEEIESAHKQKTANTSGTTSTTNASTTASSELPSTSSQSKIANNTSSHSHTHGHAHSHSHAHSHGPTISATHSHAHAHFGKYGVSGEGGGGGGGGAGGYVLNEHGMLMTHDYPSHGAVMAAAISNGDNEFVDIKMEDYDAADLRLTSEEMSQWQDVIKMDDYLAKGRRPQFWEEPFTRRVLDAIKNKRLEMKKAARILGVSYGTLYGRYREVYGCLKHPYSSTMRPSQSSQLAAVQPRFDIVWPSPKRDSGMLQAPLDIGKIRPKDLSELWARPQI